MAKFYGNVGFAESKEDSKGNWVEHIVDHKLYGEVKRNSYRYTQADKVIPDIVLVNTVELVADWYAVEHFSAIRYVEYNGVKWRAQSILYERPRITVTLGEVWHGSKNQIPAS